MQHYENYKESDIEWVGEIPDHWLVKKFKYLIRQVNSKSEANLPKIGLENIEGKTGKFIESNSEFEGDGVHFLFNDVLFGKLRPYLSKVYLSEFEGKAVGDFFVYRVGSEVSPNFISKLLLSKNFIDIVNSSTFGSKMPRASSEYIGNLSIAYPSIEEQTAIANYLDQKLAKIDVLIREKRQLIKLYEEEKAAVIVQAVTKGVDANVKTKDSGIEWLGDIPDSWEVKKLKHLIKNLESGVSVNSIDEPATKGNFGILKTSCVYHYDFDSTENKEILPSELSRAKVSPKKGGIIISRMNTPELVGASGYIEKDYPNLFLPDRLWQTEIFEHIEVSTKWLAQIFKSLPFRKYLSILATGTSPSMKNLGQEDFLNIKIPFVSIDEQNLLVEYIEKECKRIDSEIIKTKRIIELQQEYRTALISEAVTGKFKVPMLLEKELD